MKYYVKYVNGLSQDCVYDKLFSLAKEAFSDLERVNDVCYILISTPPQDSYEHKYFMPANNVNVLLSILWFAPDEVLNVFSSNAPRSKIIRKYLFNDELADIKNSYQTSKVSSSYSGFGKAPKFMRNVVHTDLYMNLSDIFLLPSDVYDAILFNLGDFGVS